MRFKEFLGEWVTTTLESLTKNEKKSFAGGPFGSDLKAEDYTLDGVPIIQLSNITEDYLNFNERLIFTSEKKADSLISNNAYPGDLIIAKMMPAGRCCIAQNLYNRYVLGSDAIRVNLDVKKCNKLFMREQINTQNIRKKITSKTAGSTRQRIGIPELKNLTLFSPSIEEQNKIGAFLLKLDTRIETQSKIIGDLELVKKGIYNHIFTQLNSVEKVLLEDLLIDFNKRTLTNKQYPILSSTLSGIYLQEDYFNKQAASASTEGYKLVPYGFATYRSMSDTGEFRFNLQTIVENGIVSPAYPVFTCIENYRLDFILFCLNYYDDIKKQLFSMKQGGTRLALHFNSLCKLYIPQIDKEKQSKIMTIVNTYNDKIVVEKQILEKLKEQKKFLLSNMFI